MKPDDVFAHAKRWAATFALKNHLGAHLKDDLTQEAAMAILKAVQRHKPGKGMPLVPYAKLWAFALMRKYMNSQGSVVSYGRRQPAAMSFIGTEDEEGGRKGYEDRRTESGNAHELVVARQAMARASNERQYAMVSMRIEGFNLEEIGAAFGVSRESARTILDDFGQDMIA